MSNQPAKNLVFKFRVDSEGEFHFEPDKDWIYTHNDKIQFQCETGPFSMGSAAISGAYDSNPLGFPLKSAPQDGAYTYHAVDTKVTDYLTDSERETLRKANISSEYPEGFVGRFRYIIFVTRDGKHFIHDQKNGVYAC